MVRSREGVQEKGGAGRRGGAGEDGVWTVRRWQGDGERTPSRLEGEGRILEREINRHVWTQGRARISWYRTKVYRDSNRIIYWGNTRFSWHSARGYWVRTMFSWDSIYWDNSSFHWDNTRIYWD
jgi:hypothetical protein